MNWIERWNSIAARIEGLLDAANFVVQALQIHSTVAPGTTRVLRSETDALQIELRKLHEDDSPNMPEAAATALGEFVSNGTALLNHVSFDTSAVQGLSPFFVFRSRFSYLIRDSEVEARHATEFAFEHLRRLIAVDAAVRNAWKLAFKKGEVACERLGSVHLLSHGIWAFKVQGHGAATDLVYNEPLARDDAILRRSSKAIVLTEWKLLRSHGSVGEIARQARLQASDYAGGVLGDLELKRTRYVVLVSEKQGSPLADVETGGTVYRHIWLPVAPDTPSAAARRRGRSSARRP